MFKSIDLFPGAGGLSLGLLNGGFENLAAIEIEKDFARSFKLNHPSSRVLNKSIFDVNFKNLMSELKISELDLLSGGPPCQGFSTVGSKNPEDKRNSLFWEFLRAVDEIKPRFVLFENVSGFKTMYKGIAFNTLARELGQLGYGVRAEVVDAVNYGAPQFRKRTIVVGFKKGYQFSFPNHSHAQKKTSLRKKWLTLHDVISDLPPLGANESNNRYLKPKNEYQLLMRDGVELLTEHNSSNYGEKMKKILSLIPEGGSVKDLPEKLQPKKYFNNTYARLKPDVPSPTITRNFGTPSSSRCIHPFQNRALSTREGARLQGFPDSYIFYGGKTSKNLQIGNAVPVALAEALGKEIFKALSS